MANEFGLKINPDSIINDQKIIKVGMKNRKDLLLQLIYFVGDGTVGEEETVYYEQCPLGGEFPASEDISWPTCDIKHCVDIPSLPGMAIRVVKFSSRGYKIRKIFAEKTTYPSE